MNPVFLIVTCLSLSQADPAAPRPFERAPIGAAIIPDEPLVEAVDTASPPDAASSPREKALVDIDSVPVQHSQDELLQALFLPQDRGGLGGRPISLTVAVGSVTAPTPAAREAVVQAYWRLSEAVASYHIERQMWQTIEALSAGAGGEGADATIVRAALASSSARIQEAKVEVNLRQRELAERMGQAADAPLPLSSDLPHIGTYTTRFEQIYSNRPATATARRIHATLPLEVAEIALRAEAVVAAGDAVDAALDQQRQRIVSSTDVVAEIERMGGQERAFVRAVSRYNQDIASYALPLAPGSFSAERLVAMLIKTTASTSAVQATIAEGAARSPDGWSPVQPADYTEPIDDSRTIVRPPTPARTGQPTLAPPQEAGRRQEAGDRRALESSDLQPPATSPFSPGRPMEPAEIPASPVNIDDERPPADDGGSNEEEGVPDDEEAGKDKQVALPPSEGPFQRQRRFNHAVARAAEANEVPMDTSSPVDATSFRLYSALDQSSPSVRTRRLNELLHWAEPHSEEAAPAVYTLSECLETTPPAQRLAAIEAYWAACSLRARLRMYQECVGRFDVLQSLLLTSGDAGGRPREMLQLRAAKLALEADAILTERKLTEAQLALMDVAGKSSGGEKLLPATTPLAGRYLLRIESLPAELAGRVNVQRLIDQIPAQQAALDETSAAIVLADRAGAQLTAAYLAGQRPLNDVLVAMEQQLTHTKAFLDSINNYNRSIADYALVVLPASSTASEIVAALVHEKPREL